MSRARAFLLAFFVLTVTRGSAMAQEPVEPPPPLLRT